MSVCACAIRYACYMHHNVSLFSKHVYFTFCADPPEFTVPSQNFTRFATGESFTFDCTPSGGNPAVYSYTFRKGSIVVTEGVSGSVLTINPVVRGSRGVYTCEASNAVGMATVSWNLFINGKQSRQFEEWYAADSR